jgi:hypothetical protein
MPICGAMQGIGDDDDEAVEASSASLTETEEGFQPVFFDPRPLRNLRMVDEIESLSPIMDFKVCHIASALWTDICVPSFLKIFSEFSSEISCLLLF